MNAPRVMIAAVSSSSGKTTFTCGILQALVNRNLRVTSFKCGPDYIDPMFHTKVIGTKSRNLDTFFCSQQVIRQLFSKHARQSEISVMEGVMGYYDGLAGTTVNASSYELAKITKTPVILVVNCKGMSVSVCALIRGFLEYQPDSNIKGILLNQVSPMMYATIKNMIEEQLPVQVLGYLPYLEHWKLESRHLGLITADEIVDLKQKLSDLAKQVEQSINIPAIIALAQTAVDISADLPKYQPLGQIRIGYAKDKAFCFYYQDNLDLLEELGAQLVPFSPLTQQQLPEELDGLLLGGGYPELYAKELAQNQSMRQSIQKAINQQMPCIAECGGFMYLHQTLDGLPMVGAIQADCYPTTKLRRFGYITLIAQKDNLLCTQGEQIPAHEFHYWDSTDCGVDFVAQKPLRKTRWNCIHANDSLFAGYPHLYFYGNVHFAEKFIKQCMEYRERRM